MSVAIPIQAISLQEGSTVTIYSVTWQDFESILEDLGEDRHTRVAYYHGTLEIMSPFSRHERPHRIAGDIVKALLDAQGRDWEDFGSTTLKRSGSAGVEPDTCFYVNHRLNWDPLPLAGQTVLVTRADTPQQNLRFLLEQAGAEVLEMPTLAITPPSSWQPLDQALTHLADYDWLILTSANAVTFFMARLHHHGCDSRALAGIQIAVVGEKTAQILEHYGLKPDCIPAEFVAAALLPHLTTAKRILFPRVESGGRDDLTTALRQQGSRVDEVPAYESRCPAQGDPAIWAACQAGEVQVITFTSSKTVQHFVQLWQQSGIPKTSLDGIKLAVIGPKTAATCRELLGRVDIQAQPYTLEGLVQSLIHSQAHP